jgi:hypothetical protein
MVSNKVSNNTTGSRGANPSGAGFVVGTSITYKDPLSGKEYPSWMVEAVDQLLFKIRHKSIWEIVDFCIEVWAKKNPKDYQDYFKYMKRYRASRKNKYGSTKDKSIRSLVQVPRELTGILNKIAIHRIEEYGEDKFWKDFAKKYPGFRGGEKY